MMVVERRGLRPLKSPRCLSTLKAPPLASCYNGIGSVLIGRMVQQASNIVDEQWIKLLRDLLLVCKIQCAFKGDPMLLLQLENLKNV